MKTESESIEATLRRSRNLFTGFVAHIEDTGLPKCVMFGELIGGAGCVGGTEKIMSRTFPRRTQSFRHQRRPVVDCSPGRREMTQGDGTRGGTFYGEIDRWRESQGRTMACSSMPERDGKDQGKNIPKQAGSCWFARHS